MWLPEAGLELCLLPEGRCDWVDASGSPRLECEAALGEASQQMGSWPWREVWPVAGVKR